MSLEQRYIIKETSLPVTTQASASAALGDLSPSGFAKKMEVNDKRQFFEKFVQKHNSGLMALLKKAEDFGVNELGPLVERDLQKAALGQVENVNDRTEESESVIMD